MARKTVVLCDKCQSTIEPGTGSITRVNFTDARKGTKIADLCDSCSAEMPGRATGRRGRKVKDPKPE